MGFIRFAGCAYDSTLIISDSGPLVVRSKSSEPSVDSVIADLDPSPSPIYPEVRGHVASAVLFNHIRFRHSIPFANYMKGTAPAGR